MDSDNFSESNSRRQEEARTNWSHLGPMLALGVGLVAVAAFAFVERSEIETLGQQATTHQQEIAALQSHIDATEAAMNGNMSTLQGQLDDQNSKTSATIAKVQSSAIHHADTVAEKVQTTLEKQTSDQQQALNAELAGVKNATSDASSRIDGAYSKIDGVGADVNSVKTDLASAKTSIDNTTSDLQRARGDMGVMSGLIATNSKQIDELRALGDRNIYEFTITKGNTMQKVGDVEMRLTKADPKRSNYTMIVFANDKMIEKKDKTSNEPVQFYVGAGTRAPYEVVVNEVGKNTIKGYLATPKVNTASK
jgi:hypothetical protein